VQGSGAVNGVHASILVLRSLLGFAFQTRAPLRPCRDPVCSRQGRVGTHPPCPAAPAILS
jgi:hypothetical protein